MQAIGLAQILSFTVWNPDIGRDIFHHLVLTGV
jgi:hypothetical protein